MRSFTFAAIASLMIAGAGPIKAQSLQDRYNAAQAAFDAQDWPAAANGFSAILPDLTPEQRRGPVGATLLSRLGIALVKQNLNEEAISPLEEAERRLMQLAPDSPERLINAEHLGKAAEVLGDLDTARTAYGYAYERYEAEPLSPLGIALMRTSIFADPDMARAIGDAALSGLEVSGKGGSDAARDLAWLRARVELNHEKPERAADAYDPVLKIVGRSFGRESTLKDALIRLEAALPLYMAGQEYDALRLIEESAIGRAKDWISAPARLELPSCAPASHLTPTDMMIVRFSLNKDGTVSYVEPIYSSRPGEIEDMFLTRLRETSWSVDSAQEMHPFFRRGLVAEVRCSNEPQRQWVGQPYFEELVEELGSAEDLLSIESLARRASAVRQRVAEIETAAGPEAKELLAPLLMLSRADATSEDSREDAAKRVIRIADSTDLALDTRARLAAFVKDGKELEEWIARAGTAQSGVSVETLALLHMRKAWGFEDKHRLRRAKEHYHSIVDLDLPDDSQLVNFARLRIASIAAQNEDDVEAAQQFAATGLTPGQCSLIDRTPPVRRARVTIDDYPSELYRRGMGAQVTVSYDVGTNGRVSDQRIIYASPPFIVNEPVLDAIGGFRYAETYRAGGSESCQGVRQTVLFRPH